MVALSLLRNGTRTGEPLNRAQQKLRNQIQRLLDGRQDFLALPTETIVRVVVSVAERLAKDAEDPGSEWIERLAASSGLSPEMVAWGVRTTFEQIDERSLHAAAALDVGPSPNVTTVVLAGNVFLAAFEPLVLLLLRRSLALAKTSSKDDAFPHLFLEAIREEEPRLAAAVEVVQFAHDRLDLEALAVEAAEAVVVVGSDETIDSIRKRVATDKTFVGKGHGFGVVWIPEGVTVSADDIRAIATDVAAYDQRGCLSPQLILVEGDQGLEVARRLGEVGLPQVHAERPLGRLSGGDRAKQMQWRGVARSLGELFESEAGSVSYEDGGAFRMSPGFRNIQVLPSASRTETWSRMRKFGRHLKVVGVVGVAERRELIAALSSQGEESVRVCAAGEMQRPPFGWQRSGGLA